MGRRPTDDPSGPAITTGDIDGSDLADTLIRGAGGEHVVEVPDQAVLSMTATQIRDVVVSGNTGEPSFLGDGGQADLVLSTTVFSDNAGPAMRVEQANLTLTLDEVAFEGNTDGSTVVLAEGSMLTANLVVWHGNTSRGGPAAILVDGDTGVVSSPSFHANAGGQDSGAIQVQAGDLSFDGVDFGDEGSADDNTDFDIVAGEDRLEVEFPHTGACSAAGCDSAVRRAFLSLD